MSNDFNNPPFLDNLIPLKGSLSQQQTADWTPGSPVHSGLGCRVHADQMIPVADGIALGADIATPKVEGRYPAVVVFAAYSHQLQSTGAVTINQALSKLHPSFNFPQGQNAVKGQGVRAASLRGVGPAYTLILVNGKRRHVSAQLSGTDPWPAAQVVDLNVIPVSAVDHVEVLRDGAAAQYGSDAIAGVVNIVRAPGQMWIATRFARTVAVSPSIATS